MQIIYIGEASFCDNLISINETDTTETVCTATTLTIEDLQQISGWTEDQTYQNIEDFYVDSSQYIYGDKKRSSNSEGLDAWVLFMIMVGLVGSIAIATCWIRKIIMRKRALLTEGEMQNIP